MVKLKIQENNPDIYVPAVDRMGIAGVPVRAIMGEAALIASLSTMILALLTKREGSLCYLSVNRGIVITAIHLYMVMTGLPKTYPIDKRKW